MEFQRDLSLLGWDEVKKRQEHRLPLVDEWINFVQMQRGKSVLDIGPGPGVFTLRYAQAVGNTGRVTAIEKSQEAVEYLTADLAASSNDNLEAICGDAEEIDFAGLGHIDIIMLTDILHHSDSPANVLQNIYAGPNTRDAQILIAEFDPESEGQIGPPLHKRLSEQHLTELLQQAGFAVVTSGKQLFEHYYILAHVQKAACCGDGSKVIYF